MEEKHTKKESKLEKNECFRTWTSCPKGEPTKTRVGVPVEVNPHVHHHRKISLIIELTQCLDVYE